MNYIFISLIYFSSIFICLVSVIGYGKLFDKYLITNNLFHNFYNYFLFLGLISIGSLIIVLNYFIPVSDLLSLIVILTGAIIFFVINIFGRIKLSKEILNILIITTICFLISFFAGLNDDFDYHYQTIQYYKNGTVFDIIHTRQISYNSHWLFLNSIFSVSSFLPSIFILGSLIYSVALFDFYKNLKKFFLFNSNFLKNQIMQKRTY